MTYASLLKDAAIHAAVLRAEFPTLPMFDASNVEAFYEALDGIAEDSDAQHVDVAYEAFSALAGVEQDMATAMHVFSVASIADVEAWFIDTPLGIFGSVRTNLNAAAVLIAAL